MVHLLCEGTHYPSNIVKLKVGLYCYPNTVGINKGRWYYELEYVEGNDFQFLATFYLSSSYLGAYPNYYFGPYFYAWSNSQSTTFLRDTKKINVADMNITDIDLHERIGIGIDIDTRMMYFRSGNNVRIAQFWTSFRGNYIPYIFESNSKEDNEDTVHVYFDKNEFKYEMPYGFLPWGVPLPSNINRIRINFYPSTFVLLFIIIQ